jgi:hypothetical protein
MKCRLGVMAALCFLLPIAVWAKTERAPASSPEGWIDILPNGSFDGWTRVAIPPDKTLDPISQWKLGGSSKTLICDGDRGHEWLRYDRQLANFILRAEWRFIIREGLKGYNSGIFVRNGADGRIWHQAQAGVGNDGYLFGDTLHNGNPTGIRFSPKPKINHLHPAGQWNMYELRCDGPKILLWVNGELTSEFSVPEVPRGYLGLEAEGFQVEFRNLQLKILL